MIMIYFFYLICAGDHSCVRKKGILPHIALKLMKYIIKLTVWHAIFGQLIQNWINFGRLCSRYVDQDNLYFPCGFCEVLSRRTYLCHFISLSTKQKIDARPIPERFRIRCSNASTNQICTYVKCAIEFGRVLIIYINSQFSEFRSFC